MRLARDAADADMTFSPVVNETSQRMALAKQIRELRDEVPASRRLSMARSLPIATQGQKHSHLVASSHPESRLDATNGSEDLSCILTCPLLEHFSYMWKGPSVEDWLHLQTVKRT